MLYIFFLLSVFSVGTSLSVYSQIEFPVRKFQQFASAPICLIGWCVRGDGATPDHFRIRIGKRTIPVDPQPRFDPVILPSELVPENSKFGLETTFRTGKGLKWIKVEAVWKDGSVSSIGQRLIHVRKSSRAADTVHAFSERFTRTWRHHQKLYSPLTIAELRKFQALSPKTIDFLLPIHPHTSSKLIQRSLDSLISQPCENWTVTLVVSDENTDGLTFAERFTGQDSRIQRTTFSGKSVEEGYNIALEKCQNPFVALIEPGDTLSPEALQWWQLYQAEFPETDVFYSDEDVLGHQGEPEQPLLKPAHSPHLLEEYAYWGQLTVYRRSKLQQLQGWRSQYGRAATWELQLRLQKQGADIQHLPKVLYHRLPESEGGVCRFIPEDAGRQMLRDYLETETSGVTPVAKGLYGAFSHRFPSHAGNGLVSIIIPFRDKPELLQVAVESIIRLTTYPLYEIILVDNDSQEKATLDLLKHLEKDPRIRVSACRREFNFSALINHGAAEARGEYLLFLNNDTQVITPDWLDVMVGYGQRKEIGAVGALLYFEDGTLQHAGAVMGLTGLAGHAWSGLKQEDIPGRWADFTRDSSVVTAACLLVRKALFDEVGGFREKFTVCGNDVDFCLTLHEKGYRNVVAAMARLFHFESKSRDPGKIPHNDFVVSLERYAPWLEKGDPYWHPALSLFQVTGLPKLTDERPIHLEHLRSVPGGKDFTFKANREVPS